ncbi:MAG: hypothetical protein JO205_00730 [Pseudolabrys sp.]|nr:hypothetical protein [Pseudolabrys sp.]MBV9259872.1 hypothetical protein [Pseudolabrys sp.]
MRTFVLALGAIAMIGFAIPAVSVANAQDTKVVIKSGHHDRGLHRGWYRGHHYGWRHHHRTVVIRRD